MKNYGLVKHLLHVCLHLRLHQQQMQRVNTVTSSRPATEPPIISSVNTDSSPDTVLATSVVLEETVSEVVAIEEVAIVVVVVTGGRVGGGTVGV